jgi:hypothetical protein
MRSETFIGLAVVAAIWSGCGDDVGRAAGQQADNLDDAGRWFDDIIARIRGSEVERVPLATRMPQIADDFEVSPELKRAWDGLVWDVGCDLATGEIPSTREELGQYIVDRGVAFALAVQSEAAAELADQLIAAVDQDPLGSLTLCGVIDSVPPV